MTSVSILRPKVCGTERGVLPDHAKAERTALYGFCRQSIAVLLLLPSDGAVAHSRNLYLLSRKMVCCIVTTVVICHHSNKYHVLTVSLCHHNNQQHVLTASPFTTTGTTCLRWICVTTTTGPTCKTLNTCHLISVQLRAKLGQDGVFWRVISCC